MMRVKGLWSYLAVIVCLGLLLAVIPAMPDAAAAGDPVAELVDRLGPVYDCLDAEDKDVIRAAKDEVADLDSRTIEDILTSNGLITDDPNDPVKNRLGDDAASTLA